MIRLESEIEFPPSPALPAKAAMISRMEALKLSSDSLMSVIQARISAEDMNDVQEIAALSAEQERIINNMKAIIRE